MQNIYQFKDYHFFTEMSNLAIQNNSFDLSLGLPDFPIDPLLKNYLRESVESISHHYESLEGNPLLIDKIQKFNLERELPIKVNHKEISIVPCSTFGLFTSLKMLLLWGDEVIIIQPSYYTYAPSIVMNGGTPIYCELDDDFSINWNKLQSCISEKTKAIIVNSPQNPTGKLWTAEDWNNLYEIIKNKNIYILSEEVYDLYCYDEKTHFSPMHHPQLRERCISIFSFGKMFHATGWKVSYILGSEKLLEQFRQHQQYISYSSNAPCQYAIANYLDFFKASVNQQMMQEKRDLFCQMLTATPFEIDQKAEGGFYQLVNFRNINNKITDVEFSKWLTIEKKVSCLPLSAFYHGRNNSDYIRFSFAKRDEVIIDALEYLQLHL